MSERTNVLSFCLREIPSAIVGVNALLSRLAEWHELEFQFVQSRKITKQHLAWADVVVCIRGTESFEAEIVGECGRLGKYVVYYLDDDLLNITSQSTSYKYFEDPVVKGNIRAMMNDSRCLWTNNPLIREKYGDLFEKSVVLDAPALIEPPSAHRNTADGPIVIGFSGGIDHQFFLDEFLEEPVRRLHEKYRGRIRFEFFGARPRYANKYNIQYIPYQSTYSGYLQTMRSRQWDIGLAPLPDTDFHACKYFNKFLEYASIGAVGIYSKVLPYTRIVEDGVNGILIPNSQSEWYERINRLVSSGEELQRIREKAQLQIETQFSAETLAGSLSEKLDEIVRFKANPVDASKIRLSIWARSLLLYKLMNLWKKHGLYAPVYVLKRVYLYLRTKY